MVEAAKINIPKIQYEIISLKLNEPKSSRLSTQVQILLIHENIFARTAVG